MIKYFILTLILIALTACTSGGDSSSANALNCGSGTAPYYGCWVAQGCQSVTNPVNDVPVWGTITYDFASDNKLYEHVRTYTNSSCNGSPVYTNDDFTGFSFSDMGAEMLPSGLTGHRLHVLDTYFGSQAESEVLVAVTNNQLCLSESLQLGSAEGYTFVWQQTPTNVDFSNNCLDAAN